MFGGEIMAPGPNNQVGYWTGNSNKYIPEKSSNNPIKYYLKLLKRKYYETIRLNKPRRDNQ